MTELKDYQLRMQQEFNELDERTNKLLEFFYYEKNKELDLPQEEILDMCDQMNYMIKYREILKRRCIRQGIPLPESVNDLPKVNLG